jgi:hypothetical protein
MPLAGPDRQPSVAGNLGGCSVLLAILLTASPCASAQTPASSPPQLAPPGNQLKATPRNIPFAQSSEHYLKLIPLAQNYQHYLKLVSSTPADPSAPRTATSSVAPAPPLTAATPALVKSR